jgi:undecaprenyl-diphosphatase
MVADEHLRFERKGLRARSGRRPRPLLPYAHNRAVLGGWDTELFYWINRWPEGLAPVMWFFTEAMNLREGRAVVALMALSMFAAGAKTRRTIVQALLAFPVANEMTDVLKALFAAPRPFQELPDVVLRSGWSDSFGTASAHAANMGAVAFVFAYHLRGWGAIWVGIAFLTGLSRIYNGVHYPSQVLLGWALGAFAGLVVTKTWEAYVRLRARRMGNGSPGEQPLP